jgi:transmembrane sensor
MTSDPAPSHSPSDPIAAAAAAWVLRLDRGLTASEQDEYAQWLASDPRHREAIALHRWGWEELDRLAGLQASVQAVPDPDLLRPAPRRRRTGLVLGFSTVLAALAASVAVLLWPARPASPLPAPTEPAPAPSYALAAPIEQLALDDGSVVALNRGAVLERAFTPAERRVRLLRGEATFTVAHDPARPFVVHANGVDIRALGTVFNVRLEPKAIEVLVTEGRVQVTPASATASVSPVSAPLEAGHRTVVLLDSPAAVPVTSPVSPAEIAQTLVWQPRLLDFTDAPLPLIIAEFNRRNPVRLVAGDAFLASLRLSASFRSDNVEGFVRLMESDFGLHAEWRGETEIVLTRK